MAVLEVQNKHLSVKLRAVVKVEVSGWTYFGLKHPLRSLVDRGWQNLLLTSSIKVDRVEQKRANIDHLI